MLAPASWTTLWPPASDERTRPPASSPSGDSHQGALLTGLWVNLPTAAAPAPRLPALLSRRPAL